MDMKHLRGSALLLLLYGTFQSSAGLQESEYKTSDWTKTLKTMKEGIQRFHTYYTYFKQKVRNTVDLISGSDGVCRFKCPDAGEKPFPRPGYIPTANGCGTPLFGFHFNIGIPSITNCCNQHDRCYGTCGQSKRDCDQQFQVCLKTFCRSLVNVLGLDQRVQACELGVSLVFNAVEHLGCKPYLDSQRAACACLYKDSSDL